MKKNKIIENGIEYEVKIHSDGSQNWRLNGKYHRENGPAVIYPDGRQSWCLNGKHHRESRPAVIYPNGYQCWYLNGKHHRENGPAIIYPDGRQYWFLNGIKYSKENYYKELLKRDLITKTEAFLELI